MYYKKIWLSYKTFSQALLYIGLLMRAIGFMPKTLKDLPLPYKISLVNFDL